MRNNAIWRGKEGCEVKNKRPKVKSDFFILTLQREV